MTELDIKAAVRERDGFLCTQCGLTNDEHKDRHGCQLHVHRVVPWSDYSLDGCITVCSSCHGKQPKTLTYGTVPRKFTSAKLDDQLLPLVQSVALQQGKTVQDYLSDLANKAAAEFLGVEPINRNIPMF